MGVVLKRAIYFITCSGRMYYPVRLEEDAVVRNLLAERSMMPGMEVPKYHQMSLFEILAICGPAKYDVTYTSSGTYYRSTKQRIIYRTFFKQIK